MDWFQKFTNGKMVYSSFLTKLTLDPFRKANSLRQVALKHVSAAKLFSMLTFLFLFKGCGHF